MREPEGSYLVAYLLTSLRFYYETVNNRWGPGLMTVAPTLEGGMRDWVQAAGQRRKRGARRQVVPGG